MRCSLSGSSSPSYLATHILRNAVFTLQVNHEDFNEGIIQVQAKKKANLSYYA